MENTSERAATPTRYVGVEETLAQVREHIHTHGPYDGILGFSQGASRATLLCLEPPRVPPFKLAVMVAGFAPNDPRYSAWCDPSSPIAIPSMYIYGATDERVPPAASMWLSSCFEAPQLGWRTRRPVDSGVSEMASVLYSRPRMWSAGCCRQRRQRRCQWWRRWQWCKSHCADLAGRCRRRGNTGQLLVCGPLLRLEGAAWFCRSRRHCCAAGADRCRLEKPYASR